METRERIDFDFVKHMIKINEIGFGGRYLEGEASSIKTYIHKRDMEGTLTEGEREILNYEIDMLNLMHVHLKGGIKRTNPLYDEFIRIDDWGNKFSKYDKDLDFEKYKFFVVRTYDSMQKFILDITTFRTSMRVWGPFMYLSEFDRMFAYYILQNSYYNLELIYTFSWYKLDI